LEKIIIVGGGGNAKVIASILLKLNTYKIIGYVDFTDKGKLLEIPFLGKDDKIDYYLKKNKELSAVIGVGQTKVDRLRFDIFLNLKQKKINLPAIISPRTILNREVNVDEATIIYDNCVINSGTTIGKCVIVNTGSIIEHDCMIGDFVHISPGSVIGGGVSIGENSFIGLGAKVIQSVKICPDCLIGAGSVVLKDCSEPGVYVGVPAKRIK